MSAHAQQLQNPLRSTVTSVVDVAERAGLVVRWAEWLVFVAVPVLLVTWGCELLLQGVAEVTSGLAQAARRIVTGSLPARAVLEHFSDGVPLPIDHPLAPGERKLGTVARALCELEQFLGSRHAPSVAQMNLWRDAFGFSFMADRFRLQRRVPVEVTVGRRRAWLVWDYARGNTGRVRVAALPMPSVLRLLQGNLRAWVAENRLRHRGAIVARQTRSMSGFGRRVDRGRLTLCWHDRYAGARQGEVIAGGIGHLEVLEGGLLVYLERDVSRRVLLSANPWRWAMLPLLLGIATVVHRRGQTRETRTTLRRRLTLFLVIIVAAPLGLTVMLVVVAVTDREELRRQELTGRAYDELLRFDDGFQEEIWRSRRVLKSWLADATFARADLPAIVQRGRRMMAAGEFQRLDLRDWDGRRLLLMSPDPHGAGFTRIAQMLAEWATVQFDPNPELAGRMRLTPSYAIAQELADNLSLAVGDMMYSPRTYWTVRNGDSTYHWYWELPESRAIKVAVRCLLRSERQSAGAYLGRHLVRNRALRLLARTREDGRWFPGSPAGHDVHEMVDAVRRTGLSMRAEVRVGGAPFLAVAMAGARLAGTDLVALVPLAELQAPRQAAAQAVLLLLAAALVSVWLAAGLLARGLVQPVDDIMSGIAALRLRRPSFRIPVREHDELGRMAAAFNTMIDNVDEWAMARQVHALLLPERITVPRPFAAELVRPETPAIDGQLFDGWPDGERRWRFLIGEVSGGGVNAALVMAMIKASWFTHCDEVRDAATLPTVFGDIVRSNGGRTLHAVMGLLDADAGVVELAWAGTPSIHRISSFAGPEERLALAATPALGAVAEVPAGGWRERLRLPLEPGVELTVACRCAPAVGAGSLVLRLRRGATSGEGAA